MKNKRTLNSIENAMEPDFPENSMTNDLYVRGLVKILAATLLAIKSQEDMQLAVKDIIIGACKWKKGERNGVVSILGASPEKGRVLQKA